MGNRGAATLMFGARIEDESAVKPRVPDAWASLALPPFEYSDPGLWDLCESVGPKFTRKAVGYADSDEVVIGYQIAHAYCEALDVASLDVPDEARAKVVALLAALGITEAPRVILVAGYE